MPNAYELKFPKEVAAWRERRTKRLRDPRAKPLPAPTMDACQKFRALANNTDPTPADWSALEAILNRTTINPSDISRWHEGKAIFNDIRDCVNNRAKYLADQRALSREMESKHYAPTMAIGMAAAGNPELAELEAKQNRLAAKANGGTHSGMRLEFLVKYGPWSRLFHADEPTPTLEFDPDAKATPAKRAKAAAA